MEKKVNEKKAVLFAILSVLLWSTMPTVVGLLQESTNFFTIVIGMITIGAVAFGIKVYFDRGTFLEETKKLRKKDVLVLFLGGVFLTTYWMSYYYALHNAPRIEASIINFLWPITTMLFAIYIFRTKPKKMRMVEWILVFVSFVGAALIAFNPSAGFAGLDFGIPYMFAFLAAFSGGLYLNLILMAKRVYSSTIYVYFTATLMVIPLFLFGGLLLDFELIIKPESLLGIFYIGIMVFAIGEFLWISALSYGKRISIASLAYMTPLISVLFLNIFLGDTFSDVLLFGFVMIVLSNAMLNIDFKYFNATSGAVSFFLLSAIFAYLTVGELDLIADVGPVEFVISVFAILAGFTLSRLNSNNRDGKLRFNKVCSDVEAIYDALKTPGNTKALNRSTETFLISLIELEYNQNVKKNDHYANACIEAFQSYQKTMRTSDNYEEAKPHMKSLHANIPDWVVLSNYHLPIGEKLALWILGILSIVAFFMGRSGTFLSDLFAMGFSSTVVFILLSIRDFDYSNMEQDISKVLLNQKLFKRMGLEYYLPERTILYENVPDIQHDEDVTIRYFSSETRTMKTHRATKYSKFDNLLIYTLVFSGLLIILILLFAKHGNLTLL